MDADRAFWVSTCLLETACLLWLFTGLRSFLDSSEGKTCKQKLALLRQGLRQCWRAVLGRRLDKRTAEEQDWMRCRITYRVWTGFIGFALMRLFSQQLRVLFGGERLSPEVDATAIIMSTAGLLLQLMPTLLNPRSLDPWYIVTSLLMNLAFVRSEIDAREAFILLHGVQMVVATLAKRTRCSLFCAGLTSAQILWMSREQGIQLLEGEQQAPVTLIFVIPIVLMCSLRRLLHEHAVLKMDLERRTVELGAVSSLLLVCYDAVVPADENLTFMEDSPQLSGLLLRTFGGLSGKSLLDFCCKDDHDRILEHFESSLAKGAPVMALHVDMLDSDQNHLKVELLHARFTKSNERCFLIGVREMQFMDDGPAPLEQSSFQHQLPVEAVKVHDLMLTFDVPTFEILSLSSSLEGLCEQMAMEKVESIESILDISSAQGRSSFNVDLQDLLNDITHSPRERSIDNTLWFNLLGLGDVIASVVMEHDKLLDTVVGTMQIHGPLELQRFQREGTTSETLTEAKVQQLEQPRIQRPLTTTVRSLRSSRSRSSQVRTLSHSSGLSSPRSPRPIRL